MILKVISALKHIPLSKIMLETDCPYLAPQSKKGQENQPAFMSETAQQVAEFKQYSVEDVISTTTKTAKEFFGLSS